ncbi:hypothetical protein PHYSODRAFT_490663 [Phytophthora sojae]|uniref:FCP1 homology domain-containing protein n=1 Tax=Phytophthora sojae (strain P6497) TaxID=1094619 RepID=G4Z4E7_PHYSP|nr:hypothetical protein PHYSODRAFT_490663 [Phytophthora sojae]EGZ20151.1 hypothetical protein PHYSODRAFT_490663 [Phytophthora sojae]|eukprot:XP_009522868.1 hypothetical protein PHYSODRAFT_490663 [Phytophthora sojae]
MLAAIEGIQMVSVQPATRLLELFHQQYTTPFYDAVSDKRQHSPYTQAMQNVMSLSMCRQICRIFRSPSSQEKVIVLDCDNTLWGGAVAEVGASGIDLSPRFLALQRFVVKQQERGMLLALCSKNIHEDVVQAFEQRRDDMVLDMNKHVVAAKVNWQPKSENIAQLAKELSLGLDSFIFIDDNPLECNEVATALPPVTVIMLGANFSESVLDHEWVFDEGFQRTQLYQQNLQREQLRESSSTHQAFLSALGVKIVFEELDREQELQARSSSFTRVLQLHHRTNQFNTATTFAKRLEEQALLEYVATPGRTVICAHVTDRFGHYGLVSAALCQRLRDSEILRVDSFLLSCRALNRGVEHAMLRRLGEIAAKAEAATMEFAWEPTERNQPAHAFFSALSDAEFVVNGEPAPNTVGNARQHAGAWTIAVGKASQVSFLKSEQSSGCSSISGGGLLGWILRSPLGNWLQHAALSAFRWTVSSITLPPWITRFLKPFFARRIGGVVSAGSLRVLLSDPGSLEQFLAPALRDLSSTYNLVVSDGSHDDDKFRRKARHQTKLALVDHLHEEVPREIWSANRPHTHGKRGTHNQEKPDGNTALRLQLACESAQCSATIQRDSRCAFRRCRNCCYRIQRLLTRSLLHANAEARQSAVNALQVEFALDAAKVATTDAQASDPNVQWCKAHQNKRRRGEIFNPK